MNRDRIINSLNGYAFHGDDRDERFLQRHGIERLTATRDLDRMAYNPETLLESLLNETFPNGYNDNDPYFIVRRDGVQYLVLVHAGQWFVGVNAADETTGALLHAEWGAVPSTRHDEAQNRRFVRATVAILKEKCPGAPSFAFHPWDYDYPDDIPWCRSAGAPVSVVWWDPKLCGESRIGITTEDGATAWATYDGEEDEDFDDIFHAVYDGLYDMRSDALEADEWLEGNVR